MKITGFKWLFVPKDFWVGVYIEPGKGSMYYRGGFRVYVMLLPTLGFCFEVYRPGLADRRHAKLIG